MLLFPCHLCSHDISALKHSPSFHPPQKLCSGSFPSLKYFSQILTMVCQLFNMKFLNSIVTSWPLWKKYHFHLLYTMLSWFSHSILYRTWNTLSICSHVWCLCPPLQYNSWAGILIVLCGGWIPFAQNKYILTSSVKIFIAERELQVGGF